LLLHGVSPHCFITERGVIVVGEDEDPLKHVLGSSGAHAHTGITRVNTRSRAAIKREVLLFAQNSGTDEQRVAEITFARADLFLEGRPILQGLQLLQHRCVRLVQGARDVHSS